MAEPIKPAATPKSATSRIDLNKAATVTPAAGIRLGLNAKTTTTRIDISTIPTIAKAQTSRIGLGATVQPAAVDEDIYKRRTALLDTSKIPLKTTPAASAGNPRTIRIGNRPTVRLTPSSPAPATFSPGRPAAESAPATEPTMATRTAGTIKLKRPGGGASGGSPITISSGPTLSTIPPEPSFVSGPVEEETGAVWSVFALLSLLVLIGVIVVQVMTNNAAAY